MTNDHDAHRQSLRDWARGDYALEAATELLIRGGLAGPGRPWVHTSSQGWPWINFEQIPTQIGGMSGGEQRVLRLAASLAEDGVLIPVGDSVTGLDQRYGSLVRCAIAHAMGNRDVWSPTTQHDRKE